MLNGNWLPVTGLENGNWFYQFGKR